MSPASARLLRLEERDRALAYRDNDAMLYALAVGMGQAPLLPAELPFCYEGEGLKVLPSFASTLAATPLLDDQPLDQARVVHVEERLQVHRPLMDYGRLLMTSRVSGLRDLGARGALIDLDLKARDAADGRAVFSVARTVLARADGGFGGERRPLQRLAPMPRRSPDLRCSLPTRADQALLYRLTGDRNPIHADADRAAEAGFERPILHGLCTFGIACRAILRTICEYDPTLVRALACRFAAPALPGDTLETQMWQSANIVSFRVLAAERDVVVVSRGRCELAT
jgi:acyl dehydratase